MIELSVVRDCCQAIVLFVQDRSRSKSYVVVVQQDKVLSNRLPRNRLASVAEAIRREFVVLIEGVRDLPCTWALVCGTLPCSGEV
jgi:hypothetical protein